MILQEMHNVDINGVAVDRAYWTVDKSAWGEGPWQAEPDKLQWIDAATGLDCLAVRAWGVGSWCGYVGLPEDHSLFGADYDAVDPSVHGGLTFGGPCQEPETEDGRTLVEQRGVCHVPGSGRPERVFWLGFDCAHARDARPGMMSLFGPELRARMAEFEVYRDLAYVMAEVASLALQLAATAPPTDER